MAEEGRHLVAAGMRNEGAFLLEWVCWYRMLGFDILVATNDCTDHSPQMLNLLAEAGWLHHAPHRPAEGTPPKRSAYRTIRTHEATARAGWLLICDVDEFLVLHEGDGTIAGYLDGAEGFHGMGIHWKVFGHGGQETWRDELVHRMFTRCAATRHKANNSFKSLVRNPTAFRQFSDHSPRGFDGEWGKDGNIWIDVAGRKMGGYDPNGHAQRATSNDRITHAGAQLNHYVIRSLESFAMKRGTPSASALRDRYDDRFFDNFDRNEAEDRSALACAPRFDAVHAEAMALPGLARLHHLGCADYAARLAAAAGIEARDDPRWRHHMEMAGAGG